jgi:hypothetical protein
MDCRTPLPRKYSEMLLASRWKSCLRVHQHGKGHVQGEQQKEKKSDRTNEKLTFPHL